MSFSRRREVYIESRTKSNKFSFFEVRSNKHSQSVFTAAYENFLRLFFAKDLLKGVYNSRTLRPPNKFNDWSYKNKVKFTIYATPIHFLKPLR